MQMPSMCQDRAAHHGNNNKKLMIQVEKYTEGDLSLHFSLCLMPFSAYGNPTHPSKHSQIFLPPGNLPWWHAGSTLFSLWLLQLHIYFSPIAYRTYTWYFSYLHAIILCHRMLTFLRTIQPISNPKKTYLHIWESSYGKANDLITLVKSQTTRPAQDMRFLIAISCLVFKHEWRVMNH